MVQGIFKDLDSLVVILKEENQLIVFDLYSIGEFQRKVYKIIWSLMLMFMLIGLMPTNLEYKV